MKFDSFYKRMVCQSCGLSLTRHELDMYWKKIRNQNVDEIDDSSEKKKSRRKDWLDWYSTSKSDKEQY